MQERRQYVRWPICQRVKYRVKDTNKESLCSCRDLGPKGIGLELEEILLLGALLDLEIWLENQGRIVALGKIVWLRQLNLDSKKSLVGLRFERISDIAKEKIFQYMITNYREKIIEKWWEGLLHIPK